MSSSSAFARAFSPSLEAITQAIHNSHILNFSDETDYKNSSNDRLLVLQGKLAECRSVEQVIDAVFSDYRPAFKEHLLSYTSWCEKQETVRSSLERLTRSLEAQTVPPRLRVKAPEFQFTKEFGDSGSTAASNARDAFTTATATFQEAINAASLAGKKAELEFWVNKCDLAILLEELSDTIATVWNDREKSFKVPKIIYDDSGKAKIGEWVVPPQKTIERDTLIRAIPLLGVRIGEIVAIRHRSMAAKIHKKKEVSAKADVEMTEATKPGPSIQSLIDKGLNARLKKLNFVPGKKVNSRSYPHSTALANDCSNFSELVWPREKGFETQVRPLFIEGSSKGKTKVSGSVEEKRRYTDCQEEDGQGKAERPEHRSKRERKGIITEPSVSLPHPSTYPDEILNYSWDHAVTYVHLHTPIEFLEAGLYRNSVHCSDGVLVPPEISNDLSLGLKYMFFTPPNRKLIMEAWSEFQIRLRWRIFFLFKEGVNKPYDPDYSVRRKKYNKSPPKLPQWMEFGLVMGRRYVYSTIASIPDEKLMDARKNPFAPKSYKILQFLKDNNYVITMTDKNLGLAVSERDWLIRNELKLLEDIRNYKQLSKKDADTIMINKGNQMKLLSYTVEKHLPLNELKVGEYFRSLVSGDGEEIIYPLFHGLPKIHKKPTGFRPIIPCHSVCFNPAAKFVSKELKPLIQEAPSIIHGTKDLFTRLSQLRIEPRRKLFFVTGDVVAFYPNIPLQSCINIVSSMYEQWLLDHSNNSDIPLLDENSLQNNLLKLEVFKRAIEIGNTQLITQHGEKYFEQLGGLAMGVADSPDLANLYGYHFEKLSNILHHPRVVFYGRYIDDCIGLVYAESANEALNLISDTIKFDGCVIEWAVSDSQCQFLDSVIFKGDYNQLRWRPYVKAGNNRERIPWVSHHPIDVKRGVYIGELSRLAVLCSHKEIYIEAVRDLNALYQTRGYPVPLFMSWCKKNLQERWEKRFSLRNATDQGGESVLVLKTRFDDVWNWFSATELGNTITKYWEEWYERAVDGRFSTSDPSRPFPVPDEHEHDLVDIRPDLFRIIRVKGEEEFVPDLGKIGILGSRWIVSRKRNTNLFDLANVWKKIVFRQLDENIAQEGGVDPTIPNADEIENPGEELPHNQDDTDNVIQLHRRERSQELEHPEFGRQSKTMLS
jgi:hypothetical protein